MTPDDQSFVDTSDASYAQSMNFNNVADVDFDDEDFNTFQDDDFEDPVAPDSDSEFENLDEDKGTGNDALEAYLSFAKERGIEANVESFNADTFSKEDMEYLTGRYYAQKYYSKVDPRIIEMAENGVSIEEYMQNKQQLLSISEQDPIQLAKSNMYNQMIANEIKLGTIKVDANNVPDEQSRHYLIEEVNRRASNLGEERMKQLGQQVQDYYKQSAEELPAKLVEQRNQQYNEQISIWNRDVETMSEAVKSYIDKEKSLVVEFSGQPEKDDFLSYVKQSLTAKDDNGEQIIPLYHKLQNDSKFLLTTLRLLHMNEKGYHTDSKNRERNAAFGKLSVTPIIGKGGNSGKQADSIFVDTSAPNYQKNFNKR